MYIRTDDEHNVLEVIVVGAKPTTNGYEVDTIDESILSDIFSYKYIDGSFVKNDNVNPLNEIIDDVKNIKLNTMSSICNMTIENGVDIGDEHYSLTGNDQINIMKLESNARLAPDQSFPYHADGKLCRLYTAEEIINIATVATSWILYWTTYYNHLKTEILAMTDASDVVNVKFGQPLTDASMESFKLIVGDTVITIDPISDGFDYESLLMKPDANSILSTDQRIKDDIAEAEESAKQEEEIRNRFKSNDEVIDNSDDEPDGEPVVEPTIDDTPTDTGEADVDETENTESDTVSE